MATKWIETLTGSLEQKKQYRNDMARLDALSEPYRGAAKALHRYFLHYGALTDGTALVAMLSDHVDLWERAEADGSPVRDVVGADPVDFADTFVRSYAGAEGIDKERARLVQAIDDATRHPGTSADA